MSLIASLSWTIGFISCDERRISGPGVIYLISLLMLEVSNELVIDVVFTESSLLKTGRTTVA